jgi:sodium transport system ATP-binding protein
LQPDGGSAHIDGLDLVAEPLEARKRIGFLSGSTGLYGRLSARENVEYFGKLHGMDAARIKRRCDELFEQLQMHDFAHKRADHLSTGMKQKTAIARTVIHEPSVVILDEPTTGLDVMSSKILLDFIASYRALKIPLIFSTHHLHEVDKLCDRVCIINKGLSAFTGTVEEFRQYGGSHDMVDAFVSIVSRED